MNTTLVVCFLLVLSSIDAHVPYARGSKACRYVCQDLPHGDTEPVCMMFSRYKRSYEFFANMCQARRAICQDNLFLHLVHPFHCFQNRLYYMPVMRAAVENT